MSAGEGAAGPSHEPSAHAHGWLGGHPHSTDHSDGDSSLPGNTAIASTLILVTYPGTPAATT